MDELRRARLAQLLRKRRRAERLPALRLMWSSRDVAASAVSDDRQQSLLDALREGSGPDYEAVRSLPDAVLHFVAAYDIVVVIDEDVEDHPAIAIPGRALVRPEMDLREMYPSGFLVFADASVLLVDFGELPEEVRVKQWIAAKRPLP